jgi:hypothetical protein
MLTDVFQIDLKSLTNSRLHVRLAPLKTPVTAESPQVLVKLFKLLSMVLRDHMREKTEQVDGKVKGFLPQAQFKARQEFFPRSHSFFSIPFLKPEDGFNSGQVVVVRKGKVIQLLSPIDFPQQIGWADIAVGEVSVKMKVSKGHYHSFFQNNAGKLIEKNNYICCCGLWSNCLSMALNRYAINNFDSN